MQQHEAFQRLAFEGHEKEDDVIALTMHVMALTMHVVLSEFL
jgi:hypothetical protein